MQSLLHILFESEFYRHSVWSPCGGCGDLSENWFCLACGSASASASESSSSSSSSSASAAAADDAATETGVFCSRHVNAHMFAHFRARPSHCVAYSLSDASVWCFACDSYVDHARLRPVFVALAAGMFGADSGARGRIRSHDIAFDKKRMSQNHHSSFHHGIILLDEMAHFLHGFGKI